MAIIPSQEPAPLDGASHMGVSRFNARSDHKHAIDLDALSKHIKDSGFATKKDLEEEANLRSIADTEESLARSAADADEQAARIAADAAETAARIAADSEKVAKDTVWVNVKDHGAAGDGVYGGDPARVLSNAPRTVDGFFVVPKVVE